MHTIRCSVAVEVNGQPLHLDKKAKEVGVQILDNGGFKSVRILGFKRDIRVDPRDVGKSKVASSKTGRLAFEVKGMKIILANGLPEQLDQITRVLFAKDSVHAPSSCPRKSSGVGPEVSKRLKTTHNFLAAHEEVQTARLSATPQPCREQEPTAAKCSDVIGFGDMPQDIMKLVLSFWSHRYQGGQQQFSGADTVPKLSTMPPVLWSTCRSLNTYRKQHSTECRMRISSQTTNISAEMVVESISQYEALSVLDLSGFTQLHCKLVRRLADVLVNKPPVLREVRLRGCKMLSDSVICKLLASTPAIEVLDILDIPDLSAAALAVRLRSLHVLAAGSTGRARSVKFSHTLLARMAQQPPAEDVTNAPMTVDLTHGQKVLTNAQLGGSPLTHMVLPWCIGIQILPKLPRTLNHLDLRGVQIELPAAAVPTWRPLACCPLLHTLCMEGITSLSSEALLACISSLPNQTQLRVLDVAGTAAKADFLRKLPQKQTELTHLRVAYLSQLSNDILTSYFFRLHQLEVLDVSSCTVLEAPMSSITQPIVQHNRTLSNNTPTNTATPTVPKSRLRVLALGETAFGGIHLEATRRSIATIAPEARVTCSRVDLFDGYLQLPPALV